MRPPLAMTLAILLLLLAAPAFAGTMTNFSCLTGNLGGDCAIGESQLSVEVSDLGGGNIRFHFRNSGPAASSISEIYFDDGTLLALASVLDGPNVDFEPGANPANLPGGQMAIPPFQVTAGFLAESVPSPVMNGVGPSQWVMIDFTLQGGQGIESVIADLADGDLRIGIHVIGFASGGSESFINVPIPEPSTAALLAMGLAGLAATRRSLRSR